MIGALKRALALSVVVAVGCGGSQPTPGSGAAATPAATPLSPREEAPDLSPVEAPRGLVLVGRLKTPIPIANRMGRWLGIPAPLLDMLPGRARDLARVLDPEAPVEVAGVLDTARGHDPLSMVVSLGVTSLAEAVEEARAQGARIRRVAPGVVRIDLGSGPDCAVAVSLGRAPARLVCADGDQALEALLPFATRGLPNLEIGPRELELSVDVAAVVAAYGAELDGARLLSGFVIRQLELDDARFDRALSEAVNGVADELVLFARDVSKVRLGGVVSEERAEIVLDFEVELGQKRSLVAAALADLGKHAGPPPASFFTLPGDAQSGGYSLGFDAERWARLKDTLVEVVDAFMEHDKVGRAGRDRMRGAVDLYFNMLRARATAAGDRSGAASDEDGSWGLSLYDEPPKALAGGLADLEKLIRDRDVRRMITRRLGVDDKLLPSARFVPLRAAGVPAGTRGLLVTVPKGLVQRLREKFPGQGSGANMVPPSLALAVAPHGDGAVFAFARDQAELSGLLGAFLGGKGPTLADRSELAKMRELEASGAYFATLASLFSTFSKSIGIPKTAPGSLPLAPVVVRFESAGANPPTARLRVTIPRALVQAVPQLIPSLLVP
jgi:hypothetical protein